MKVKNSHRFVMANKGININKRIWYEIHMFLSIICYLCVYIFRSKDLENHVYIE